MGHMVAWDHVNVSTIMGFVIVVIPLIFLDVLDKLAGLFYGNIGIQYLYL